MEVTMGKLNYALYQAIHWSVTIFLILLRSFFIRTQNNKESYKKLFIIHSSLEYYTKWNLKKEEKNKISQEEPKCDYFCKKKKKISKGRRKLLASSLFCMHVLIDNIVAWNLYLKIYKYMYICITYVYAYMCTYWKLSLNYSIYIHKKHIICIYNLRRLQNDRK